MFIEVLKIDKEERAWLFFYFIGIMTGLNLGFLIMMMLNIFGVI